MGTANIDLGRDYPLRDPRVKVNGAAISVVRATRTYEDVYLDPENVFPAFTLYDFGFGSDTPLSRVMTEADTQIMNRAHRIREKYITHLLTDPNNTVPITTQAAAPKVAAK